MGVQVEARAQCCSSRPVSARGGCADRCHALVPVGCAGQPGPVRVSVSLRTLACRTCGSGGGGCPASPGRRTCGSRPGGAGLGPVVPAGLVGSRCDDCAGFELVHHRADHHRAAGAVSDGLGLVGEAACGDTPPGALVAVALPPAAGAEGPFPSGCGGPVGGFAVPQRGEALGAVLGGVARRDGDDSDPRFGGEVAHVVHDLSAHLLGEAGVHGAAHASGFHRPQVFDVDHRGRGGDGLIHCPACGSPREGVVEVRTPVADVPDLIGQDRVLGGQRMLLVPAREAGSGRSWRAGARTAAGAGAVWRGPRRPGTVRRSRGR